MLAWLSILAKVNAETSTGNFKGVPEITEEFWKNYGRNYYCRYDYENCDSGKAD